MKKIFLFFLLLLLAFGSEAQVSKAQTQTSIDSLLPTASAIKIAKVRYAFTKALNFAEPSNFAAGSITLPKISKVGASEGQIPKIVSGQLIWSNDLIGSGGASNISGITGLQDSLSKKVNVVFGKGLSQNDFTNALKSKLDAIAAGATANSTDAFLLGRNNHTGVMPISGISTAGATDGKIIKYSGGNIVWGADDRKSVKTYGATGNGISDETAAFQTYINSEKEIYIPSGVYKVGTLNIPSDRRIYGDGAGTVLIANANNTRIFNIYSASGPVSNVTVENLKIDGGGQTTNVKTGIRAAYGVYVSNANNVKIKNLVIDKCGIMHPTNDTLDNTYGGYGVIIESRYGLVDNISVDGCKITNIAGGGHYVGDAIYIAGYSSDINNVPKNISVTNCTVENVGRHCFTVAGERPESWGENVIFSNCYGKNAALSGIDLEEGNNVIFENVTLEGCGNYTGFYNPNLYGANYRLRTGIAYGNLSTRNTFRRVTIKNCYYGVTLSAGQYNTFQDLTIESSTISDLSLGLARMGENLTLQGCKFLSTGLAETVIYNGTANASMLIENCIFKSPIRIGGLKVASFKGCFFSQKVTFSSSDNANIEFDRCKFSTPNYGLHFNNQNTYCNKIKVTNCDFIGTGTMSHGIFAVFHSVKDLRVDNCTFSNLISTGVYHDNSDNEAPFISISNNSFDGMPNGIKIVQAVKYATIAQNNFRNISGLCIENSLIISGTNSTNCVYSENKALSGCVGGIKIEVSTGSIDKIIIKWNDFSACTGTAYSISAGNAGGFNSENL